MDGSYKLDCWASANEEIMKSQYPLHRACRDGDVETLSLLLMEAQHGVYVEDSFYGWTPAHWAAYFGKLACLKCLQVSGMNCDCTTIRLNQTPAHIAAQSSHSDCLHWLLECATVGIDRQDYMGETAVHKAARCGSIECASLLVANGAQLHICNNGGLTPARLAASCGQEECTRFLQSAAAQKQPNLVNGATVTTLLPGNSTIVMETSALLSTDQNGDCEMEVSDSDKGGTTGYVCDVTLSHDISASLVRVAGRKRAWDCGGMAECKRMRRTDLFSIPPPECATSPLALPQYESLDNSPSVVTPQPITDNSLQDNTVDHRSNVSGFVDSRCRCCMQWRCQCTRHEPFADVLALSVKPMTPVVIPLCPSKRQEEHCYSVFV